MEVEGKLKGQRNKEAAAVYLLNGKKICEITARQSWRKIYWYPFISITD